MSLIIFVLVKRINMVKEYRNYWFHIGKGLIGQIIGIVICGMIGLVVGGIL